MFILSSCHLVTLSSLPLADSDNGAGKIIGAVIFLAIWAVSAIGSWIKKQQEKQKQGHVQIPELPSRPEGMPTTRKGRSTSQRPSASGASRSRPPRIPPIPQRQRQPQIDITPDTPRTPIAAPLPSVRQDARPAAANPQAPATSRPQPSLSAPAIAGWLKPRTLRQQFILTEIFQPPIALRDRPE